MGFFLTANLTILIWSSAKSSVFGITVFSQGDCANMSWLNAFLHFLLNIPSSLMIASSNFFMQVLNSPTRAEVDRAHGRKRWLEIGVPSLRNVLNVSPYKSFAWVLFSLSSVPIHFLFNSSILTMDYNGSDWSMALVSESFLHGAPYSLPGAALTLGGTKCERFKADGLEGCDFGHGSFGRQDPTAPPPPLSATLTAALTTAAKNLTVSQCKSEYQRCHGLRKYRNVLLVVDSGRDATESSGWAVRELYDMESTVGNVYGLSSLISDDHRLENETFSSIWQPYFGNGSISQPNSLWFTSDCSKTADSSPKKTADGCYNSCTGPLGTGNSSVKPQINDTQVKSPVWEFAWVRENQTVATMPSKSTWGEVVSTPRFENWPNECAGIPRPPYQKQSIRRHPCPILPR